MAQYNETVGVIIEDQLDQLSSDIGKVASQLQSILEPLRELSNIKMNKSLVSQLERISGLNFANNGFSIFSKQIDSVSTGRLEQLTKRLKEMQSQYNAFLKTFNKNVNMSPGFSNIQTSTSLKSNKLVSSYVRAKSTSDLTGYLKNISDEFDKTNSKAFQLSDTIKRMFSLNNLYAFKNNLQGVFRTIIKTMNYASAYTETENKFARAMGDMYNQAISFQDKLTSAYGMSAQSMMDMQATFKNMLTATGGLSNKVGEQISEIVSMMTIDYSSLFNTTIEQASTKFQAALSKQVRPIRQGSGYDITQSSLQQTLDELGMNRKISQLSQIEQRLVIILTLQRQMARSNAFGDFARTIETPANQVRILQEQIKELGRWISAVFYGTIGHVLPYINGFIMALNTAIKTLAMLFGYEMPNSSGGNTIIDSLNNMGDSSDHLGTSLGNAGKGADKVGKGIGNAKKATDKAKKSAEEWKNVLMGFDVANVLPSQDKSSSSSGDGGSGGGGSGGSGGSGGGGVSGSSPWGVDQSLIDALKDYTSLLDNVNMKAKEIRDAILGWGKAIGKWIDENIFLPMWISWQKYGKGVKDAYGRFIKDAKYLFSDFFKVVGDKWYAFFGSLSNLFVSLQETAGIVLSTISNFFRHVWDAGGKTLIEGIFDISTAFIRLATSINDNFVKPVLKFFRNDISGGIGDVVGFILGIVGNILKAVAAITNAVAENKYLVQALGVVVTVWLGNKAIRSISALLSSLGGVDSLFTRLIFSLGIMSPKLSGVSLGYLNLLSKFQSGQGILFRIVNGFRGLSSAISVTTGLGSIASGISSIGLVGGIALPVIFGLGEALKFSENSAKKYNDEIDRIAKGSKDAVNSFMEVSEKSEIQARMLEKNINSLKKLSDSNGYVGNLSKAEDLIKKINGVLPNTVRITENGKIEWLKTNEQIQKSISLMKEKARTEAYSNSLKKLSTKELELQIQKEKLLKEMEKKRKEIDSYKTGSIQRMNAQKELADLTDSYNKVNKAVRENQKDIDNLDKAYNELGKNGKKSAEKIKASMIDTDKKVREQLKEMGIAIGKLGEKTGNAFGGNMAKALQAKAKEVNKTVEQVYKEASIYAKQHNVDFSTALDKVGKKLPEKAKDSKAQAQKEVSKTPIKVNTKSTGGTQAGKTARDQAQKYATDHPVNQQAKGYTNKSSWSSLGNIAFKAFKYAFQNKNIVRLKFGDKGDNIGFGAGEIRTYATGGFPDVGQLFIAREKGAEMVGSLGGRSNAVANNYQIENGIYRAVLQAMRESGTTQGGDLYLTIKNSDGTSIQKVIKDYNKLMRQTNGEGGFNI